MIVIWHCDNLSFLQNSFSNIFDLIYIDVPFGTNKIRRKKSVKSVRDLCGNHRGFEGQKYKLIIQSLQEYNDRHDNYLDNLWVRLKESYRVLKDTGSFFIHADYRNVHYIKILLDMIFGEKCFMNEIIWIYDFGARSKSRWPIKHNTILWYVKNTNNYTFNFNNIERVPYLSPWLQTPEKKRLGKTLTDCWWNTIVPTNSKEKTGYPTQKPLSILERIVKVHSNPHDLLLDFYAGSGSFGEAAAKNNRQCVLVDNNPQAIDIMKKRLSQYNPKIFVDEQGVRYGSGY